MIPADPSGGKAMTAPVFAAPTNDRFWNSVPFLAWNKSSPIFDGVTCVCLRSSPSIVTLFGTTTGLFSVYKPAETLIAVSYTHLTLPTM